MASGELTVEEKQRVNDAVTAAEVQTGFEFCVIVSSRPGENARSRAERAFHRLGMHERPGVMIMVVPHARTLEIVTASEISGRLSDQDCEEAVRVMTGIFSFGNVVEGLERGIEHLVMRAGPRTDGRSDHFHGVDLPNIIDLDDPELDDRTPD